MDTLVDYIMDNNVIAEEREYNLLEIPASILSFGHFEMPVRIVVGGIELLDWAGYDKEVLEAHSGEESRRLLEVESSIKSEAPAGWYVLALLNVAWLGVRAVSSIGDGEQSAFSDTDSGVSLHFTRVDDRMYARSSLNNRTATAPCSDVVQAFSSFSLRVRNDLIREVPILARHPFVGDWFAGTVDSPPALSS